MSAKARHQPSESSLMLYKEQREMIMTKKGETTIGGITMKKLLTLALTILLRQEETGSLHLSSLWDPLVWAKLRPLKP
jgi:hypothetical protein